MKKKVIIYCLICVLALVLGGCKEKQVEEEKKTINITVNNERRKEMFQSLEKTEEDVPDEGKEKLEIGIRNWARATLGIDSSFSEESEAILNEKLYEIIISDEQKEDVKKERTEFYKDSQVRTDVVEVDVKKANKAIYEEKTIGYVECNILITGTRNEEAFEKKYHLVLLMDYQENIASVYEIVDIKLEI